ncbi:DotU family type IV/VI secretion system protein [Pandoraea bronchicola]|uniref:Type IV / VI secretion system DotU domain-containing protein n=1 Tax=Pandoraea bronchicola TaxID=2508287 RepID=A0A5E5BPY2_9BURK|nr:DotU family type IV/VI secretion system protein [Pandoraea bronchicola]VVE88351.1 hypothetical protein PBR20603_02300 [Pandoraea bronchicola]
MNAVAIETAASATTDTMAPSTNAAASVTPIRPFMRDVALLVATLAGGGTVPDSAALRARSQELLDEFDAALARGGIGAEVKADASVALCALLDETALRYLSDNDRAGWEFAPLQVERFGVHDAGERVFARLDTHLATSATSADVLEFYSAILGLGFVGRYALLGDAKRRELIADLDNRIAALRPQVEPPFVIERTNRRLSDWFCRLSPWAMAGLACVIAALVWGVWHTALSVQLSHIVPAKSVAAPHAAAARP